MSAVDPKDIACFDEFDGLGFDWIVGQSQFRDGGTKADKDMSHMEATAFVNK